MTKHQNYIELSERLNDIDRDLNEVARVLYHLKRWQERLMDILTDTECDKDYQLGQLNERIEREEE